VEENFVLLKHYAHSVTKPAEIFIPYVFIIFPFIIIYLTLMLPSDSCSGALSQTLLMNLHLPYHINIFVIVDNVFGDA
jgi:hypothetical protein